MMIIFIGGIHGVGKGTLARKLSDAIGLIHFSASKVLKWEEVSPNMANKRVQNIPSTQERLISGLNEIKKKQSDFILDGHFCLFNKNGMPERIPLDTFNAISPSMVVIVVESPVVIRERIKKRDNKEYQIELLSKMQGVELSYAKEVAFSLSIPYFELSNENLNQLINSINKMKNENIT